MYARIGQRAARGVRRADGAARYVTEVASDRIILPRWSSNCNPMRLARTFRRFDYAPTYLRKRSTRDIVVSLVDARTTQLIGPGPFVAS
jgi:hypothetical protein